MLSETGRWPKRDRQSPGLGRPTSCCRTTTSEPSSTIRWDLLRESCSPTRKQVAWLLNRERNEGRSISMMWPLKDLNGFGKVLKSLSLKAMALQRLLELLTHLRAVHRYCLFCGCTYDSAQDMEENCPGVTDTRHKRTCSSCPNWLFEIPEPTATSVFWPGLSPDAHPRKRSTTKPRPQASAGLRPSQPPRLRKERQRRIHWRPPGAVGFWLGAQHYVNLLPSKLHNPKA